MQRMDDLNPTMSIDEEDGIAAYLRQHPDLLRQRAALLPALDIPHASGGTISLRERQVRLLREQNLALQARLGELLTLARHNELIDDRLHSLTLMLIGHPPVTVECVRWIEPHRLAHDAPISS